MMGDGRPGDDGPKAQVAAVLALHSKRVFDGDGYGWAICVEDRQHWPCATVETIEAAVCATCKGETWITEAEMQCGGDEHEHTESCVVPIQVTCPSCTTLAERKPHPVSSNEEPF